MHYARSANWREEINKKVQNLNARDYEKLVCGIDFKNSV
jgi:hypothetical protein